MNGIAIVHYHLNGGGVNRVIDLTAQILTQRGIPFVLLTGEPTSTKHPCALVDGLGYRHDADPVGLAERMQEAARHVLGGDPEVWHVHNHSIGKNAALPPALTHLSKNGAHLLLQIHDFAEDGRPQCYDTLRRVLGDTLPALLYPGGQGTHYATINQRDSGILKSAGVPAEQVHYLPNALDPGIQPSTDVQDQPPLFLWPSRPLRRKNPGELILWALRAGGECRFATCLPATDAESGKVMEHWQRWANQHRLPISWEVCDGSLEDFFRWCGKATALLSTSISEGFGLSFIEPWAQNRPVTGRDLPEITSDFSGVNLEHLYPALLLPRELIDQNKLRKKIESAGFDIELTMESFRSPAGVDFGRLDEELQTDALNTLSQSPDLLEMLLPPTPALPRRGVTESNAVVVRETFSPERYGDRLQALYAAVMECESGPAASYDAEAVRKAFATPDRVSLLRTGTFQLLG